MNSPQDMVTELERIAGRALGGLPLRQAPKTLEARVMALIAQEAALPWQRKGFLHWPLAAQGAFLAASIAFVQLGLSLWESVTAALPEVATADVAGFSWMRTAADLAVSLNDTVRVLLASIPQPWLYGAGATILMLYTLLFGIGALGLRVFQVSR